MTDIAKTARSEAAKQRVARNKEKYGEDFYRRIGKKGGNTKTDQTKHRGFASSGLAHEAGSLGGRRSAQKYGGKFLIERSQNDDEQNI